jgi:hypothetical protein
MEINPSVKKGIKMKSIKLLTLVACTVAWFASTATLQAETCCEKAKAKKEECSHKCCIEAAKTKTVCEKCNPKKKDK